MKKVGGIGRIIIFAFLCTGAVSPGELCAGKPFQGYAARHAEEQRILEKALDADPRDHVAATRLGEVYWQKGKKKAAIKLFRRAIRAAPEYSPPYFFIGKAYFFEKKPEKGTAQFDIFERKMDVLISSDKSLTDFYVSCLYHMSYLYSTLKRYEDVAGGYKKIIKIKPDEQKAHYNLAVCYYKYYNRRLMAYKELKRVIEIDTNRHLSNKAEFFIEYMRKNPDFRYTEDISFIEEEE